MFHTRLVDTFDLALEKIAQIARAFLCSHASRISVINSKESTLWIITEEIFKRISIFHRCLPSWIRMLTNTERQRAVQSCSVSLYIPMIEVKFVYISKSGICAFDISLDCLVSEVQFLKFLHRNWIFRARCFVKSSQNRTTSPDQLFHARRLSVHRKSEHFQRVVKFLVFFQVSHLNFFFAFHADNRDFGFYGRSFSINWR